VQACSTGVLEQVTYAFQFFFDTAVTKRIFATFTKDPSAVFTICKQFAIKTYTQQAAEGHL
jgi:hypothetical protein